MSNECTLVFEEYGELKSPDLVILHGFFASSRNWRQIAKKLSTHYHVYVVDMRNHGTSPHDALMNYPVMAADIQQFLRDRGLTAANILGHSMGGKVAMYLALTAPEYINNLIVVDIAPISYQHSFDDLIRALKSLPLPELNNRKQADEFLADAIPETSFRQFLLQNLVLKEGKYQWRIDLDIFAMNADFIIAFPKLESSLPYLSEVLFLAGEQSNYIKEESLNALFPYAKIQTIAKAGHWVQAEQPEAFCQAVQNFLSSEKS